jgi:hypothetical protein
MLAFSYYRPACYYDTLINSDSGIRDHTVCVKRDRIRPSESAIVTECNMAGSIYFLRFQHIGGKPCRWICANAQLAENAGFVACVIHAPFEFARLCWLLGSSARVYAVKEDYHAVLPS